MKVFCLVILATAILASACGTCKEVTTTPVQQVLPIDNELRVRSYQQIFDGELCYDERGIGIPIGVTLLASDGCNYIECKKGGLYRTVMACGEN